MNKISINHMSNRHNDQLRALDFYKQDLRILKGRLTQIAGRNTGTEVLKEVEHFENQFRLQMENIDRLSHNIQMNVGEAGRQAAKDSSAGYVDGILLAQHNKLGEAFHTEEKIINTLRHDFNLFAATWM